MNNLKDEIAKEIGSTEQAKRNTWNKLQGKPKRNKAPIIVLLSTIAVAGILFLLLNPLQQKQFDEALSSENKGIVQDEEVKAEVKQEDDMKAGKGNLAYKLQHRLENVPFYISIEEGMTVIDSQSMYNQYNEIYHFPELDIDFTHSTFVIVSYTTDGCGGIVEGFSMTKEEKLIAHINLPIELQNKKEYACTAILMPNVELYQLEKVTPQSVGFSKFGAKNVTDVMFNSVIIDPQLRDFAMVFNDEVTMVTYENKKTNEKITVTDLAAIQQMNNIFIMGVHQGGINDMIGATHEFKLTDAAGKTLKIELWVDESSNNAALRSSRNEYEIYILPQAQGFELLKLVGVQ